MTIGAFAERTGLSVSALRFYAGQGLLEPAETDRITGYRHYAEAQVDDGILIGDLRRLDMSLRDIALALERSEPERKELVERHLRRLEQVVERARTVALTMGITNATKETAVPNTRPNTPSATVSSATVPALDLAGALDQTLPAAGVDPERPDLMSVLIEGKDGSLRLVATDGFRLAIRDLVPTRLDGDFSAVVPAATLSEWRSGLDQPGPLVLTLDEGHLSLAGDDRETTARIVPVTFPDYERFLVPADDVARVKVDRQRLLAALGPADEEHTVEFSAAAGVLRVEVEGRTVDIEATVDGPPPRVALDGRFVADAVGHAIGAEVVMEIEDPLSPVLFRSADDGTFTSRIMPIKLD